MQRQSLGSPNSKLQIHEAEEIPVAGGPKRRDSIDHDNDCKDSKSRRLSFSPSSTMSFSASSFTSPPKLEKLIHLIPLLTLLCFLVLYLTSYTPSQSDLAYFNGFKHPSKLLDSSELSDAGQLTEFQKGDIWAIRSLRNLHELTKHAPTTRSHRKIAHF